MLSLVKEPNADVKSDKLSMIKEKSVLVLSVHLNYHSAASGVRANKPGPGYNRDLQPQTRFKSRKSGVLLAWSLIWCLWSYK